MFILQVINQLLIHNLYKHFIYALYRKNKLHLQNYV